MPTDDKKTSVHDQVVAMADMLKLEGDERESYVTKHMSQLGWKPNTTWTPPEGTGGKGDNKSSWL